MTRVICELSHNHQGQMPRLKEMVHAAKEAGAWGVKIQTHFARDLTEDWQHKRGSVESYELSWDQHAEFAALCRALGLEPLTSVYTFAYAGFLNDAGFKHIKIGSAEANNADLVRRYVVAGFKVHQSTGGRDLKDVAKTSTLECAYHCVSKYPSLPNEANVLRMLDLKKYFPFGSVGFSDHTCPGADKWDDPSKLSCYLGAKYLERHFTVLPRLATKDGVVSIDFEQLKEICRFASLSPDGQLAERPQFGMLKRPLDGAEAALIASYEGRWVKNV